MPFGISFDSQLFDNRYNIILNKIYHRDPGIISLIPKPVSGGLRKRYKVFFSHFLFKEFTTECYAQKSTQPRHPKLGAKGIAPYAYRNDIRQGAKT